MSKEVQSRKVTPKTKTGKLIPKTKSVNGKGGNGVVETKAGAREETKASVPVSNESKVKKASLEPQSDLKKLVLKGKDQGFLTYAEINDHLPENMHDTDQIEVVVNMINDMGIEVVDKAPDTDIMTLKRDNPEDQESCRGSQRRTENCS